MNSPRMSVLSNRFLPFFLKTFRNVVFLFFLVKHARRFFYFARLRGMTGLYKYVYSELRKSLVYFLVSSSSSVQLEVTKQVKKTVSKIAEGMRLEAPSYSVLPMKSMSTEEVRMALEKRAPSNSCKLSGTVYHNDALVIQHQVMAFSMFNTTNPLHPEIFPGVRQMEADILQMILNLFHGPSEACGNLTSGGTESILMACKAYRDLAKLEKPQMVIPVTAHAAFDKAGHYFNIEVIKIPIQKNGQVDLNLMKRAITCNTIMIVGSAPNFPHGIIDDIQGLSTLALKYKVPLHVDACLGSFLLPFLGEIHSNPPIFDFQLEGVTSISMDPHKYGLAPKGISAILYKSSNHRKHQYFLCSDWTGGIYGSPSMSGSRSGALIAACWATMLSLGMPGYQERAKKVLLTAKSITEYISTEPKLQLIGTPLVSVVAFSTNPTSLIYFIYDGMTKRNWHLNLLQSPAALHVACTVLTHPETFIQDLKDTMDEMATRQSEPSPSQAIYGSAAKVESSIVNEVVSGFLDLLTADLSKET